jgi:hypothetical protein
MDEALKGTSRGTLQSLESTMSVQEKYVFFLKRFKEQRLMRPRLR